MLVQIETASKLHSKDDLVVIVFEFAKCTRRKLVCVLVCAHCTEDIDKTFSTSHISFKIKNFSICKSVEMYKLNNIKYLKRSKVWDQTLSKSFRGSKSKSFLQTSDLFLFPTHLIKKIKYVSFKMSLSILKNSYVANPKYIHIFLFLIYEWNKVFGKLEVEILSHR